MTEETTCSGWITATGEVEGSTSNLAGSDRPTNHQPETRFKGGLVSGSSGEMTPDVAAGEYILRPNDDASGGLMATVRTQSGSAIMGRSPRGNDVIMIEGMPVDLNVAALLGYVTRNPDGSFSDKAAPVRLKDPTAAAKAQGEREEAPKAQVEADDFGLSHEAQKALGKIAHNVMPGDAIKAMDSILMRGEADTHTIERMASQAKMEPHEMADLVNTAHHGFYDVATDMITEGGIDEDAFIAFVGSDKGRGDAVVEAARAMVMTNDMAGLTELRDSFYEQADKFMPDETKAALTEAGFDFRDGADGLKVIVGGMEVSFGVAVKQGIVKFVKD